MSKQVLGDRYRLETLLGSGASARVWLAVDQVSGEQVAVKQLHLEEGAHRERMRARFGAEAEAMRTLDHPNLLSVLAVCADDDGDYIVTELCDGSLYDWQQEHGPVPARQAVQWMLQVLSGLAAAHQSGVIHRDIKPHNLLLGSDGAVRISDFGIARLPDDVHQRTQVGTALGSMAFMAPEQRLDASGVGPEADLYAVGATLYNLISAANPTDLFLAGEDSPRWEPIPGVLRPILGKATQVAPEKRYRSAQSMAMALMGTLGVLTEPAEAPKPSDSGVDYVPTIEADVPAEQGRVSRDDSGVLVVGSWKMRANTDHRVMRRSISALWMGIGICVLVVGVGVVIRDRLLQSVEVETPEPEPEAVEVPTGRWSGIWGEETPIELELRGEPDAMEGTVVLGIGGHEVRSRVAGTFDVETGELKLSDVRAYPRAGDYRGVRKGRRIHGTFMVRETREELDFDVVVAQ